MCLCKNTFSIPDRPYCVHCAWGVSCEQFSRFQGLVCHMNSYLCSIDSPVLQRVGFVIAFVHLFALKHSTLCLRGTSPCALMCVFTSWHVSLKCVCCVHSSCVGTWPTSGWGSTSLRFSSSRSRLSVCRRASPWRPHALLATSQLFWTSFFRFYKLLVYPSPVQVGLSWCLDGLEGLEGLFSFGVGDGDDGFSKCTVLLFLFFVVCSIYLKVKSTIGHFFQHC